MSENPAAFPCTGEGFQSEHYTQKGMTLRDWFAGQALAGIVAAIDRDAAVNRETAWIARDAYAIADAMLAERSTNLAQEPLV